MWHLGSLRETSTLRKGIELFVGLHVRGGCGRGSPAVATGELDFREIVYELGWNWDPSKTFIFFCLVSGKPRGPQKSKT